MSKNFTKEKTIAKNSTSGGGGGSGTVTSVGITSDFGSITINSGSPVTGSGNIDLDINASTDGVTISGNGTSDSPLTFIGSTAPVYLANRIPFGDGSTKGGTTNANITWTASTKSLTLLGSSNFNFNFGGTLGVWGVSESTTIGMGYNGVSATGTPNPTTGLVIDVKNKNYTIGDNAISPNGNGTVFTVSDANQNYVFSKLAGSGTRMVTANSTGVLGTTTTPVSAPVYTANQIVYGDGSTAGGITDSLFTRDSSSGHDTFIATDAITGESSFSLRSIGSAALQADDAIGANTFSSALRMDLSESIFVRTEVGNEFGIRMSNETTNIGAEYNGIPSITLASNFKFDGSVGNIIIGDVSNTINGNVLKLDDINNLLSIDNIAHNVGLSINGLIGFSGTVTTASLVGKTITITNGVITGFA